MDNRLFDVTSTGTKDLELICQLALRNAAGGKATHYKVTKHKNIDTLILYWHDPNEEGATRFLAPLGLSVLVTTIESWLEPFSKLVKQPDHDGDNKPGWHVFNESWGHVAEVVCTRTVWLSNILEMKLLLNVIEVLKFVVVKNVNSLINLFLVRLDRSVNETFSLCLTKNKCS